MTLYTIGHSTLDLPAFIHRLHAHGVTHIADVRSMPGSNRYPHFNQENLAPALAAEGVGYSHHPKLGGRRSPKEGDSVDPALVAGWTHKSFRSYAAWTFTDEFEAGLGILNAWVLAGYSVATLCSEAVPWRCHRSILAAVIASRGGDVRHIMDDTHAEPHVQGAWGPKPQFDEWGRITWPTEKKEETA